MRNRLLPVPDTGRIAVKVISYYSDGEIQANAFFTFMACHRYNSYDGRLFHSLARLHIWLRADVALLQQVFNNRP
ncbi:MAG: hypothetical protein M3347_16440 [Armatimonadota bacterium]|nr:hypothetical protein [Armatimonadota bacterium]